MMSGRGSRRKGADAERDLAKILSAMSGKDVRRGQVFNHQPDIIGLDGIHIEVKRVERLDRDAAFRQSEGAAKPGEIPVLIYKKNRKPWMIELKLEDITTVAKILEGTNEG